MNSRGAFLAASMVLCVASAAGPASVPTSPSRMTTEGAIPGSSVRHWMRFAELGPANTPYPVIHISTQSFETFLPWEQLLLVSRAKFNMIRKLTQATFSRADCALPKAPFLDKLLEVTLREEGDTRNCFLQQEAACPYLFKVMRLRDVKWTDKELGTIRTFIERRECPYIPELSDH